MPSIWFVWKIWDFLVARRQKLDTRGHRALLNRAWLVLKDFLAGDGEAETDTILKTEKPLGRGKTPEMIKIMWLGYSCTCRSQTESDKCDGTTRFVSFYMLSRVLPVLRMQRNSNWTQQKNRESFVFTVKGKSFHYFTLCDLTILSFCHCLFWTCTRHAVIPPPPQTACCKTKAKEQ